MEGHVNTYGGMNKDTAYDTIKPNMYIDALDIRISTDKGESQGAFTNIKGNEYSFTILTSGTFGNPAAAWTATNPEIIGYGTIRDTIVLFVADDGGEKGWIYKIEYDSATREVTGGATLLYYSDVLNFKKGWPIEALGRYENVEIQRIYWTDYNNILRTINIVKDLNSFPAGNIDIFPDIRFTQPILQSIQSAGSLLSGMYQIAYRLITSDGKETLISPPSNMIHIVQASEYSDVGAYVGEPITINASKAIVIALDTSEYVTNFEKIEFFALYYENNSATPVATSIEILNIVGDSTELIYNGAEDSIFDIELFTFTSKNFAFKTFKSISQKDNYLIGANIKSSTISVQDLLGGGTFDAKTRRYNSTSGTPFSIGSPINNLNNAFNLEFNKDKHWDITWQLPENQYKFQDPALNAGALRLGGNGPNIKYNFHLEPKTTDVEGGAAWRHGIASNLQYGFDSHDLNDGYGPRPNPSGSSVNTASPIVSSLLRGYKRGETYRFGIIFYTKKGEATYVEYVGDIKFPDISEQDSVNNLSKSPYFPISDSPQPNSVIDPLHATYSDITISFDLGIEFTIDFSTCSNLLKNITGFQIVRTPRESTDKRRLAQGIMSPLAHMGMGDMSSTNETNTNFEIENSENTMNHFNSPYLSLFNATGPTYRTSGGQGVLLKRDSLSHFVDEQDVAGPTSNSLRFPGILNTNVRSQYLSFYSPDVSYNYDNAVDTAKNLGNTPSFLITGAYAASQTLGTTYYDVDTGDSGATNPASIDAKATTENPGSNLGDSVSRLLAYSFKFRRTVPVTFNSIENIKRSIQTAHFDMRNSTDVNINSKTADFIQSADNPSNRPKMPGRDTSITPFSEELLTGRVYIRNYYVYNAKSSPVVIAAAILVAANADLGIGRPSWFDTTGIVGIPGAYVNWTGGIARAGSNLTVLIDKYATDPLDNNVTYSPGTTSSLRDYFLIAGNTVHTPITNNPHIEPITGYLNASSLSAVESAIPLVDLVIPRGEVYGGNSQNALESNTFIQASPIIQTTFGTDLYTPLVYGGDIFTSMYSCQKGMVEFSNLLYKRNTLTVDRDYRFPFSRTDLMVTESCINLNLNYGSTRTRGAQFTYNGEIESIESKYYIQEDNNTQSDAAKLEAGATTYIMYGYNSLYSKINKEVAFFIKPDSVTDLSLTNDVRSFLSAVKVNGENIDSWTKFGINDYYDVDDHGPINKILNFKDDVYFIQDKGIGNYSINREAVTTTDDGVPTELGTAKGWGKHRYLSKEVGSMHQWAVASTNNAVYFFDAIHRKIYQLGQSKTGLQTSPLSELKGMHSYLQFLGDDVFTRKEDGGDNPILLKGAHIGIDQINNEVLFTFLSTVGRGESNSIVFDEIANEFASRLSINPKIWINNGDTLLTSNTFSGVPTNLTNEVFIHNIGNWGEFYRTQTECKLTLVINPKADVNKVLRFLEFNSIVRGDDKSITRTETITSFEITTEYQNSGKIPYSAGRIKRRFDKWRIKLPRDTTTNGRFRSTHFLLTLYFDNTTNKELIMNRLVSYYSPQIF